MFATCQLNNKPRFWDDIAHFVRKNVEEEKMNATLKLLLFTRIEGHLVRKYFSAKKCPNMYLNTMTYFSTIGN